MYKCLLLFILCLGSGIYSYGQSTASQPCPIDSQCVKQSVLDKCADIADKLTAAKEVIIKFEAERLTSEAERQAASTLIKSLNDVLEVRGRIIVEYEKMLILYQRIIDLQNTMIEKLEKKLNQPKGFFQSFLQKLKEIALIATGVLLGRGL